MVTGYHVLLSLRDVVRVLWAVPDRHSYVVMLGLPMAFVWTAWLEWVHFAPASPGNPLYQFAQIPWKDAYYGVVMVPMRYHEMIKNSAALFSLKVVDGAPEEMRDELEAILPEFFPDDLASATERVFTVENGNGHGHTYSQAREIEMTRRLVEERAILTPSEIVEYIHDDPD
jgi:hypothetical protein